MWRGYSLSALFRSYEGSEGSGDSWSRLTKFHRQSFDKAKSANRFLTGPSQRALDLSWKWVHGNAEIQIRLEQGFKYRNKIVKIKKI